MTLGKGIAIPTPKKPVNAISSHGFNCSVRPEGAAGLLHLTAIGPGEIIRRLAFAGLGDYIEPYATTQKRDPEPQPEPETRAKKIFSPATIAKMKVAQQALAKRRREAKEAAMQPATKPKARKETPPKTMGAGG